MVHIIVFRISHKLLALVASSTELLHGFSFFLLVIVKLIHANGTCLSCFIRESCSDFSKCLPVVFPLL